MSGSDYREVQGLGSLGAQTSPQCWLKPLCSVLCFMEPGWHSRLFFRQLDPWKGDWREIKGRYREEPEAGPFLICLLSLSTGIDVLQHGPFTLAVVLAPISGFSPGTSKSFKVPPERRKQLPDSTFSSES